MFTLRIISGNGTQTNINIGDVYSYIGKLESPESYDNILKNVFNEQENNGAYAYIQYNGGTYVLYDYERYYIVTESGKTYDNLSK